VFLTNTEAAGFTVAAISALKFASDLWSLHGDADTRARAVSRGRWFCHHRSTPRSAVSTSTPRRRRPLSQVPTTAVDRYTAPVLGDVPGQADGRSPYTSESFNLRQFAVERLASSKTRQRHALANTTKTRNREREIYPQLRRFWRFCSR